MPTITLEQINTTLDRLNESASFAAKFGPFFFAVALLVVTPFAALIMFRKFLGPASSGRHYQRSYEDFRFYFRSTIIAGLACVVVGVGWWLFDSYREGRRTQQLVADLQGQVTTLAAAVGEKQYAAAGMIVRGVATSDELTPFYQSGMTVVFGRIPRTNSIFFVVLSDVAIPKDLTLVVEWTQIDLANRIPPLLLSLTMRLGRPFGQYSFKFDEQKAAASIQPLS